MSLLLTLKKIRLPRLIYFLTPPIVHRIKTALNAVTLPKLPDDFKALPRSSHALFKLISDFEFETVLDIGSGAGEHANILHNYGKKVTALDLGSSVYAKEKSEITYYDFINGNFYNLDAEKKYDCIWASHVLEHQPNPGEFIQKCISLLNQNGILAITVPPLKDEIEGGHLSLWNAGLLIYQLVFNGLDCEDASILTIGYNTTVIVKKKIRDNLELTWDNGDIRLLGNYFPDFVDEPFDGRIIKHNW